MLLVVNQRSYDVCREQIRGELNPAEVSVDGVAQASDGQGFRQARNAFKQHVPIGEQADEQLVDHVALPDDRPRQLGTNEFDELAVGRDLRVQRLNVRSTTCLGRRIRQGRLPVACSDFRDVHFFHDSRRYSKAFPGVVRVSQNCVNSSWETFCLGAWSRGSKWPNLPLP